MPAQSDTQYNAPTWGGSLYEELQVPSGSKILAKRLDFTDIIGTGLVDEFDSLAPVANDKVVEPATGRKKPQDRQPKKLTKAQAAEAERQGTLEFLKNVDQMEKMVRILSLVLPRVIVQPTVVSELVEDEKGKWVKRGNDDREPGVIYTDTIPLGDRMFILNWSMEGMKMDDLESFREQSDAALGALEPQPKPEGETE